MTNNNHNDDSSFDPISVADLIRALRAELESAHAQSSFWADRYNRRTVEWRALREELAALRDAQAQTDR